MLAIQRYTAIGTVDWAFRVYRHYFGILFGISLVVNVPGLAMGLLFALLQHRLSALGLERALLTGRFSGLVASFGVREALYSGGILFTWLIALVVVMFGMAAVTRVASVIAEAGEPTLTDALESAGKVFWPLLGATLVSSLVVGTALVVLAVMSRGPCLTMIWLSRCAVVSA